MAYRAVTTAVFIGNLCKEIELNHAVLIRLYDADQYAIGRIDRITSHGVVLKEEVIMVQDEKTFECYPEPRESGRVIPFSKIESIIKTKY